MKTKSRIEPGLCNGRALPKPVCLGSNQTVQDELARARESLAVEWRDVLAAREHVMRLTLNEAEALAWQSGVPHLVFPALAEEKLRAVARWNRRQQSLTPKRSRAFAA